MQRSSVHLLRGSQTHCWNQKSQIWTHQTKGQIPRLRCVGYLNSVKHLFGLKFLRLVTNELILCSRGNSSFPVVVLMRDSFIIALEGFCDCTWRNFFGLTDHLKVMMDYHFSLLNWAVVAIMWTLYFFQIGPSSVYHPYLVTTQLIGSSALRRKGIPQINI